MEELCQPTMNGRGEPIAPVNIQATDFGLKNHMIHQVQNSCQFHGLPGDDANKHLDKFLTITQSMKQNGVTDDAIRLYIFPYSLTHHATAWNEISNFRQLPDESLFEARECYKLSIDRCPNHNMLPVTQIDTFYNGLTLRHRDTINAAAGGTFMKRRPEECYDLIENMTAHHNDWDTSAHRGESSSSITSSSSEIAAFTQQMAEMRKDILKMYRSNQQVNSVTPSCETCGGPHFYYECQAAGGYTQDVYATSGTYNAGGGGERDPKMTTDQVLTESTTRVLPPVVQPSPSSRPFEIPSPPTSSSELPKRNPHQPQIPYPSRLNKEKLQDKSDIQVHKFFQMFKKLHFNISLAEALALMPKYHKILKYLLSDKEKLLGLANTSMTKNCSAVLLKKLPEKLGDPGKFLIPCDFPELEKCMALADLGASINLMPLSVWKKLMLPELVPTRMTLELANRSIAYPAGIAEDVFVQVGKFTFLDAFVVFDYDVDPRVPLILGRPFLRTARALVDVYEEELILRDGDEKLIFHADNILKHPLKQGNESINMINFIDISCEDHFQEVLKIKKSNHPLSGSPTPSAFVVRFLWRMTDIPFSHFNDSSPDYETFCFDIEEKSSGSTTPHSDHSLLEYESFCFDVDHIKEKSNASSTVPLLILIFLFLNMNRFILIYRLIRFLLPVGVILSMRSSPMNSLTSYLHRKIPSGESKVHIEVLSVLWGNRLPIPDGSLLLSRTPDVSFKKVEGIPEVEIRLLARSVRTPDVLVV
ncbi:reverse transcriptase domain-containing protein [Tanacetum coccineum]|uniref:Reverse transcriptase domain-containing protein n=1 Tax=Tanacetum coccineum TaxID=301880 RepID=A0ABQ5HE39_9ASTR